MKSEKNIHKVNRRRIYEDIAEQLEEILVNGDLKPGDKFYSENELTNMFEVSRTTIRQALTILEIKGLIERKQGAATYLAEQVQPEETQPPNLKVGSEHTDSDILVTKIAQIMSTVPKNMVREPLELRRTIEPTIASLAAKRATEEDIKNLEELVNKQAEVARQNKITVNEDSAIHFAIAKAANNSMMLILVKTLHELLYDSRYQSHLGGAPRDSIEEHSKIVEAIKNKDATSAYDLMLEHLLNNERIILLQINKDLSLLDDIDNNLSETPISEDRKSS